MLSWTQKASLENNEAKGGSPSSCPHVSTRVQERITPLRDGGWIACSWDRACSFRGSRHLLDPSLTSLIAGMFSVKGSCTSSFSEVSLNLASCCCLCFPNIRENGVVGRLSSASSCTDRREKDIILMKRCNFFDLTGKCHWTVRRLWRRGRDHSELISGHRKATEAECPTFYMGEPWPPCWGLERPEGTRSQGQRSGWKAAWHAGRIAS